MGKRSTTALFFALLCAGLLASFLIKRHARLSRGPGAPLLPTTEIKVDGRSVTVELARTAEQRKTGLMFRESLGEDEGMLFVVPRERNMDFYMKDTTIPLSIAFIRYDGVIANIAQMEPLTLTTHSSRYPCLYALEMAQGWFANNGVSEGDRVQIPADVTAFE